MDKVRLRILSLYALFVLVLVFGFFPYALLQNVSIWLCLLLIVLAYVFRARAQDDDLEHHHAQYIIRSVWVFSLIALVGMFGAGFAIGREADSSALDDLLSLVQTGGMVSEKDVESAFQRYFETNEALIFRRFLLFMAPAQLYAAWRLVRGLPRAMRGYRVSHPKSWN